MIKRIDVRKFSVRWWSDWSWQERRRREILERWRKENPPLGILLLPPEAIDVDVIYNEPSA